MRGFAEKLLRPPHPTLSRVFQSLPDTFLGIGASSKVEQTLVGFGIRYAKADRTARHRSHANKNSFVLNSLIRSLNFAAFSNSNRLAVSRISTSSFAI